MKYLPRFGWMAMVVGCTVVTPPIWAFPDPLTLLRSLSHGFLMHSSQGYLGVDLKDVDPDRAAALKLKDGHGVEIVAVDHDAPAAKAGLKPHDVILRMNGEQIEDRDQVSKLLRKLSPGRICSFVVSRDGASLSLSVQLADRVLLEQQAWSKHFSVPQPTDQEPYEQTAAMTSTVHVPAAQGFVSGPSSGASHMLGTLIPNPLYVGAEVNPVYSQLADYFGVTSGTGLLVENVDSQSPAERAGLRAGDVILKVNDTQMATRNDWLKAIRNNRGKQVQVTIMRNRQEQTLTMLAGAPKKKG